MASSANNAPNITEGSDDRYVIDTKGSTFQVQAFSNRTAFGVWTQSEDCDSGL